MNFKKYELFGNILTSVLKILHMEHLLGRALLEKNLKQIIMLPLRPRSGASLVCTFPYGPQGLKSHRDSLARFKVGH